MRNKTAAKQRSSSFDGRTLKTVPQQGNNSNCRFQLQVSKNGSCYAKRKKKYDCTFLCISDFVCQSHHARRCWRKTKCRTSVIYWLIHSSLNNSSSFLFLCILSQSVPQIFWKIFSVFTTFSHIYFSHPQITSQSLFLFTSLLFLSLSHTHMHTKGRD